MTLSFDVVDVFAPAPFAGNPLAVVHGAAALSTGQMQALAREFNLSETVFPLAPSRAGADYRARIFTPSSELPFAGHPSVGVAWVLARDGVIGHGDVVQECGAGLLPVTVSRDGAAVTGGAPSLGAVLDASALAALVGLSPDDVADPRARVCGAGVDWAFLAVRPDAVARASVPVAAPLLAEAGVTGLTVVSYAAGAAHLRFFAPGEGVPEDPATGSAAVGLGVWLVSLGLLPGDGVSEVTIDQGAEMGRPSRLELRVEAAGGAAVTTRVGGRVVPISSGTIAVPPT
jgi:trans-2,3-dihydro-3-hydroxyanthranilate isomerase